MNEQKPPELFAERPVRSDFARAARRGPPYIVRRLITVFLICAIIGTGVYLKLGKTSVTVPSEIPTIKAEGSYKQRPEQPGGIDIPHQDVQVYQALDAKGPPPPQVEHLLPPPEVPMSNTVPQQPPAVAAVAPEPVIESSPPPAAPPVKLETTASQPAPQTAETVPTKSATSSPAPAPVAKVEPVVAPKPASVPVKVTKPVKTVSVASSAPVTKPKTPSLDQVIQNVTAQTKTSSPAPAEAVDGNQTQTTAAPDGDFAVQLASMPDKEAAQKTMAKLQSRFASNLGSTQLRVVKADLGSKGIYYRIQSQPLSEAKAKSLCSSIKTSSAGCILVRL